MNSQQFLLGIQSVLLQQRGKGSVAPVMSSWGDKGAGNPTSMVTVSGTEVGQHLQVSTKAQRWGGRPQSAKGLDAHRHACADTHSPLELLPFSFSPFLSYICPSLPSSPNLHKGNLSPVFTRSLLIQPEVIMETESQATLPQVHSDQNIAPVQQQNLWTSELCKQKST